MEKEETIKPFQSATMTWSKWSKDFIRKQVGKYGTVLNHITTGNPPEFSLIVPDYIPEDQKEAYRGKLREGNMDKMMLFAESVKTFCFVLTAHLDNTVLLELRMNPEFVKAELERDTRKVWQIVVASFGTAEKSLWVKKSVLLQEFQSFKVDDDESVDSAVSRMMSIIDKLNQNQVEKSTADIIDQFVLGFAKHAKYFSIWSSLSTGVVKPPETIPELKILLEANSLGRIQAGLTGTGAATKVVGATRTLLETPKDLVLISNQRRFCLLYPR